MFPPRNNIPTASLKRHAKTAASPSYICAYVFLKKNTCIQNNKQPSADRTTKNISKKIAQYDGTAYAADSFVKSFTRINQCIIWAEYQKHTSFYPPKQSFRYRKGTKVVRHSQNLYGIFLNYYPLIYQHQIANSINFFK